MIFDNTAENTIENVSNEWQHLVRLNVDHFHPQHFCEMFFSSFSYEIVWQNVIKRLAKCGTSNKFAFTIGSKRNPM